MYAYREELRGIMGSVFWKIGSAVVYTASSSCSSLWSFGGDRWTRPWRITAGMGDDDLLFLIIGDVELTRGMDLDGENILLEPLLGDGLPLSSLGLPISPLLM